MSEQSAELTDLPPSAKLVHKVLEIEEELTQKALVEETMLSPRTVRYALNRLKEIGMVEEDVHFPDARQSIYRLSRAPCAPCDNTA